MTENNPQDLKVTDTQALFVWSSITDQVRDTSGSMSLSLEATRLLIQKYNLALSNVREALSEDAVAALDAVAPELADTVDQSVLHCSAATMAAFLNALHNSKVFEAQHQMAIAQLESHPAFPGFGGESDGEVALEGSSPIGFHSTAYL